MSAVATDTGAATATFGKDLLGLKDLSAVAVTALLDTAEGFLEVGTRSVKKVPALRGRTVVNLFYEPSTRTRTSFELAAKRLSADVLNITVNASSVVKGEGLIDTARNIEAMNVDTVVIRHAAAGAPQLLAENLQSHVINAGDGAHEHPTQGLLDLFTMRRALGRVKGLTVVIVGDIAHSRVARSGLIGLTKLGAHVRLVGPPTMIPMGIERLAETPGSVRVGHDLDAALAGADVLMPLRLQLERQGAPLFPGKREYALRYGIDQRRLSLAPGAIVMHPGPINRGVEIAHDVADGERSVILGQVTHGVAVRMAVLYHYSGGQGELA
ncbi:MAG: aspartate carbamoyltransferase catalytic subunit [Nitrospirota bacterium]|nr:aspartate carbamoyltransferase catalytic subunit [Nitrospirota bacterium]